MKKTTNELHLTLQKLWFYLIHDKYKADEYREIKPYYCARLCKDYKKDDPYCAKCATNFCQPTPKCDMIHFTLGYPHRLDHDRHMRIKVVNIRKGYGRLLWGATKSRKQFIIELDLSTTQYGNYETHNL